MASFDVHRNKAGKTPPLLLDVQADLISDLRTRLVIPLMPPDRIGGKPARLNPTVRVDAKDYLAATDLMGSVDRRQLGEVVGSLANERPAIIASIDFLLQGF